LHHGGRGGHGLSGRHSLLVAQNNWPHVSRRLGPVLSPGRFYWISPHVLPTVHLGLSWHAASLSRLSRGVPSVERDVKRRRLDSGSRLLDPHDLSDLVFEVWSASFSQSVGSNRAGVANALSSSHRELHRDAHRHRRALSLIHQ